MENILKFNEFIKENFEDKLKEILQKEIDKRVAECRSPEIMKYLNSLTSEELQQKLSECQEELKNISDNSTQIYISTLKENIKILEEILNSRDF